jgi:hypothetical protein
MSKHYSINSWADGFGRWYAKAHFTVALGNTGVADKCFANAERAAKKLIRNEIQERMGDKVRRLSYEVVANELQLGSGRLVSITWAEK